MTEGLLREEQALTRFAFHRLLEWLDDGVDSGGETYLEIRRRLVAYFDRRNRPFAEDLADETLTRVGRTLERYGSIAVTPPARYCYVTARFVLLEDIRRERRYTPLDEKLSKRRVMRLHQASRSDEDEQQNEQRLARLERCLERVAPQQRQLVIDYYAGTGGEKIQRRRNLAERLGITMNALGIRVCRIRSALQACMDSCASAGSPLSAAAARDSSRRIE